MRSLPNIAWLLGYAGLIPFALLTFMLVTGKDLPFSSPISVSLWQAIYAAMILSFLGAISWGVALGMQESLSSTSMRNLIVYSVIPSILAWFALLLTETYYFFVLASLIMFVYIVDALLLFPKIRSRYARLRLHLTLIVVLLLCCSAIAIR